jgi:hypothetical protein
MSRTALLSVLALAGIGLVGLTGRPADAQLIIDPTFDSSITSLPDAAAVEGVINSAIGIYEAKFTNPITVDIEFQDMSSGLGQSEKILYITNYKTLYNALNVNATSANQILAVSTLPNGTTNPVTNTTSVAVTTANMRALGFTNAQFPQVTFGSYLGDGVIGLNTSLTTTGNGSGSGPYSLESVAEHEIDEVLGFGSSLNQAFQADPQPEDLWRYTSTPGVRSYTTNSAATAFFSIDGINDLAQFDNQNDGGDWADWQSNPLPNSVNPEVQDAFGSPGSNPTLGVELTALNVIGYNLAVQGPTNTTPEPGSLALLMSAGFVGVGVAAKRKAVRK